MTDVRLQEDAILRVGKVTAVNGRRVSVTMDAEKNLTDLFFNGELVRNVSVGSYIEIKKGFISLIGRIDGENSETYPAKGSIAQQVTRILSVSLVGFFERNGDFKGGLGDLPLIGNEAFLLTEKKAKALHSLAKDNTISINIATSDYGDYEILLPVDGLMNSHIAIFGNTGSGKSNTLAKIYSEFISVMRAKNRQAFDSNCKLLFFDFNGEYCGQECLASEKKCYSLTTRSENGDKIPIPEGNLFDIEIISILADATEKTQKPFLRRALKLNSRILSGNDSVQHTRNLIKTYIKRILSMSDKIRADLMLDYLRKILPDKDLNGVLVEISADIDWNNKYSEYCYGTIYLKSNPEYIEETILYKHSDNFIFGADSLENFVKFCYLQLISDILSNRAQNEHIAPAINKLVSKSDDIRRIFDTTGANSLFENNVVVINLDKVNIEMKKTIPLLIAKLVYHDQKDANSLSTLNIIIDEAHNILSRESFREAESWKDYRLETFEEIIKEGRKFGVFVTISSQRPSDISPTITSQAHNYFIHRLVNERDLAAISSAVSYIDKLTEESIPTLPTGTCIFSGVAGQMPLRLQILPLELQNQPKSSTTEFSSIIAAN